MSDLELYHSNIRKLSEIKEELNILHEEIVKLKDLSKEKDNRLRYRGDRIEYLLSCISEVKKEAYELRQKLIGRDRTIERQAKKIKELKNEK